MLLAGAGTEQQLKTCYLPVSKEQSKYSIFGAKEKETPFNISLAPHFVVNRHITFIFYIDLDITFALIHAKF